MKTDMPSSPLRGSEPPHTHTLSSSAPVSQLVCSVRLKQNSGSVKYLRPGAALPGALGLLQRVDAETWSHQIWIPVRTGFKSNTLNNKYKELQLRAAAKKHNTLDQL